jgi:hypothetical protein
MKWRNILFLIRVDMKSGRLLRGQKLSKYNVKRSRFTNYIIYTVAIVIGVVIGYLAQIGYNAALNGDLAIQALLNQTYSGLLFSLPTIALIYSLVFTMLQQIQRSGVRFTRQVPFWLPVTWAEHTVASIFAEVLGLPMMIAAGIAGAVLTFSAFAGQTLLAVAAVLGMVVAVFMSSAITEVLRVLQVRFTGAVYKSSGRAAVWVRFISSLLFFVVFYIIYFYVTTGTGALNFLQTISSVQTAAWFVPFVWLGLTLNSFAGGLFLNGAVFLVLSLLFILGLVYLGVLLNRRFGLYEPPAIKVSHGAYVPKIGVLGRFGFKSVESALIRKDLKAFTRRRELMTVFILPVVFLILPIMTTLNGGQTPSSGAPGGLVWFWLTYITLFPTALMAMSMGNFLTGEEGQSVWRVYMSPISPKSYVKSKYALLLFFSLVVLPLTTVVGIFLYPHSPRATVILALEAVFLAFSAGALSLAIGIRGADFNEFPRSRMIRPEWGLISFGASIAVAAAVMLPFAPYLVSLLFGGGVPLIDLYTATAISGVVAAVLTVAFYRFAIGNAEELFTKAQV